MKLSIIFALLVAALSATTAAFHVPFNATEQLIDVTGDHAFVAPSAADARGVCPGLNALANHNFISHDGVATRDELISAVTHVFGVDEGVAVLLATLGLATSGSGDMWHMSIGGRTEQTALNNITIPIRQEPLGLSGTHIAFEGDASPTRRDLYEGPHEDDVHVQAPFFRDLYALKDGVPDDEVSYSLETVFEHHYSRLQHSIANNPYYFAGPLGAAMGSIVVHALIPQLMSNHSAEFPAGRLDRETLKSFFGVTYNESCKDFVPNPGHERIPDNFFRRPLSVPYDLMAINADIVHAMTLRPALLHEHFIGGNAHNQTNNFRSVSVEQLTGGNYTMDMLLQGNNLVCLALSGGSAMGTLYLEKMYLDLEPVGAVLALGNQYVAPLGCPVLTDVDVSLFDDLGGFKRSFTDRGGLRAN